MTDHFTKAELQCSHCGELAIAPESLNRLERLRVRFGHPMILTSAYRCPEYNAFVSTTGDDGPHVLGQAFDVLIYGRHGYKLVELAIAEGFTGIFWMQHGDHGQRYMHLDDLPDAPRHPRPWIMSYPA